MSDVLAIVPARGGSRGVPRKNLRDLNGRPLIAHVLGTLASMEGVRTVVSTEDPEIAAWCRLRGYEVIDRPPALAGDDVPVAAVATDAVAQLGWEGTVLVVQPTCPLLSAVTLERIIQASREHGAAFGVRAGAHQTWAGDRWITPRVNRQRLEAEGWATGVGVYAWTTMGPGVPVVVPEDEALDVDTHDDLEAARRALGRRRIHLRVATGPGTGHLHRAIALAEHLDHHDLSFGFWRDGRPEDPPPWAAARLAPFAAVTLSDADLILSDALDTEASTVLGAKARGQWWVSLEDLGPGSAYADLVVNELYRDDRPHAVCGPRWAVLRAEFSDLPPYEVGDGRPVLVLFGGDDHHGLSGWAKDQLGSHEVVTVGDFGSVAEAMLASDVLVSSCGRTVNEAAAVGIPTVAVAANERESRHVHVDGVIYAGLHVTVPDGWLGQVVTGLLERPDLRAEMCSRMRSQLDGLGAVRIARRIDELLTGI